MLTGLPPFYTEDEENMYSKIMTADIEYPNYMSAEAIDIISKFLKRDPTQRLQVTNEMKAHAWFKPINWEKLVKLEIEPPFKPNVKSLDDVSQIDEDFLNEDLNAVEDDGPSSDAGKNAFVDFTFAGK